MLTPLPHFILCISFCNHPLRAPQQAVLPSRPTQSSDSASDPQLILSHRHPSLHLAHQSQSDTDPNSSPAFHFDRPNPSFIASHSDPLPPHPQSLAGHCSHLSSFDSPHDHPPQPVASLQSTRSARPHPILLPHRSHSPYPSGLSPHLAPLRGSSPDSSSRGSSSANSISKIGSDRSSSICSVEDPAIRAIWASSPIHHSLQPPQPDHPQHLTTPAASYSSNTPGLNFPDPLRTYRLGSDVHHQPVSSSSIHTEADRKHSLDSHHQQSSQPPFARQSWPGGLGGEGAVASQGWFPKTSYFTLTYGFMWAMYPYLYVFCFYRTMSRSTTPSITCSWPWDDCKYASNS